MTSTRLPGKVLADACGKPMLQLMVDRLRHVPDMDKIVIATTTNAADDPIESLAERLGVGCYRGSEDDVLDRVLQAATAHGIDTIVELTGDCPLIDPAVVQLVVDAYKTGRADYVSNVLTRSYPIGMDTQVFSRAVLADVARRTDDPNDHEHVSLFIYRNPQIYTLENVLAPTAHTQPELRLTLDTPEDLTVIRSIFDHLLGDNALFDLSTILGYLAENPQVAAINADVKHRYV